MTNKIIMLRWLPASGKSTWAKEQEENQIVAWSVVRVNKDEIRDLLHSGVYSKENEKVVIETERETVVELCEQEVNTIIVDNTHLWLQNKHIAFYRQLAEEYAYDFEIKDFFITREEAIERDSKRENPVGREIIDKCIKIANNGIYPSNPIFKKIDSKLKDCYIVDIDWTLAFMDDKRSPYDFTKVDWDRLNIFLKKMLDSLMEKYDIIIMSWRGSECRAETKKWLRDNNVACTKLYMRAEWDTRSDTIVKKELYTKHILDKYNVLWVFDDRQKVVDLWRLDLNLPCFQVYYGEF